MNYPAGWPPQGQQGAPQMNLPQGYVPQQQPIPQTQTLPQQQGGYQYGLDQLPQGGRPQAGVQPGVPGTPIAQPYYPGVPGQPPSQGGQQGWPQPQGQQQFPQGVPQGQPSQGWPPHPQVPPQGQPQGQPQGGAPGRATLDDSTVIDGPGVPPELRGRTMGEARRLYAALQTDWLTRNQRPQGQAGMPQAPQAPQGQPGAPGATPQQAFWQNPDQRIEAAMQRVMAPVLQQNQAQAVVQARNIAATGMPDFAYLEPEIMQMLGSADPQVLQNPQAWVLAANAVRGQRVVSGQYRPQQHGPQGQQQGRPPMGPGYSVPAQAAQQQTAQPTHTFFTEAPTAPSGPGYGGYQTPRQATQEDHFYAQKFEMPVEQYIAYRYGQQQAPQGQMGAF